METGSSSELNAAIQLGSTSGAATISSGYITAQDSCPAIVLTGTNAELRVQSSATVITSANYGICATSAGCKVFVENGATVTASGNAAIYATDVGAEVAVTGGSTVEVSSSDTAIHTNASGASVTVNGSTVKATANGGTAILTGAANSGVTVTDSTIETTTGTAIHTKGNTSPVSVTGGQITTTTGTAILTEAANSGVTVTDSTIETTTGVVIHTKGNTSSVSVESGSTVATEDGMAIFTEGTMAGVTVNDALIRTDSGTAIHTTGPSSPVFLENDSVVTTNSGTAIHVKGSLSTVFVKDSIVDTDSEIAILVEGAGCAVEIGDGGFIYASSGKAIRLSPTVTSGTLVFHGGGVAVSENGPAIEAPTSMTFDHKGIVFGRADTPEAVVASASPTLMDDGVVVAWTGAGTAYTEGTSTDLLCYPDTIKATWALDQGYPGITVTGPGGKRFIDLFSVTVAAVTPPPAGNNTPFGGTSDDAPIYVPSNPAPVNPAPADTPADAPASSPSASEPAAPAEKAPTDFPEPITETLPALPDASGLLTAEVTETQVLDMVEQALHEAAKYGREDDGIALRFVCPGSKLKEAQVLLTEKTLETMKANGVTSVTLEGSGFRFSVPLADLLNGSSVTIVARKHTEPLPAAAEKVKPGHVWEILLEQGSKGKTSRSVDGSALQSIRYTLAKGENPAYLSVVKIASDGTLSPVPGSAYKDGWVSWSAGESALYGLVYTTPSGNTRATDLRGHWAKTAIDYAIAQGWMANATKGKFQPESEVTQQELLETLARLGGAEKATANWAFQRNLYNKKRYQAEEAVTRVDAARALYRYCVNLQGYTLPRALKPITCSDLEDGKVSRLQMAGVVAMAKGRAFAPDAALTRAQLATWLHRLTLLLSDDTSPRGWATNDSGQSQYYNKHGSLLTGKHNIAGKTYEFDKNGCLR